MQGSFRHCRLSLAGPQSISISLTVLRGVPALNVLGVGHKELHRYRKKIYSILKASKIKVPQGRVTLDYSANADNLPAHTLLRVILGIAESSLGTAVAKYPKTLFVGDVDLVGSLVPIFGLDQVLAWAKSNGYTRVVLPDLQKRLAKTLCPDLRYVGAQSVAEVLSRLESGLPTESIEPIMEEDSGICELGGLPATKLPIIWQALAVLAQLARVSLMLVGPPGIGKSLLLDNLPTTLTPLSSSERLARTRIHSFNSPLTDLVNSIRPQLKITSVHTPKDLLGDQRTTGLLTRTHRGMVVIDELHAVNQQNLHIIKEVMSTGEVCLADQSIGRQAVWPADLIVMAASNACDCGYADANDWLCQCTAQQRQRFWQRLPAGLLDRFALVLRTGRTEQISQHDVGQRLIDWYRDLNPRTLKQAVTNVSRLLEEQDTIAISNFRTHYSLRRKQQLSCLTTALQAVLGVEASTDDYLDFLDNLSAELLTRAKTPA